MTEIPAHNAPRYIIDPVAFVLALIGAPLIFTAATFWIIFIPVGALVVGGLPYLVLGTPMLLIHLRNNAPDSVNISWLAFKTANIACLLILLFLMINEPHDVAGIAATAPFLLLVVTIFSTGWGACFAWLYRALARDFYLNSVTA